MLPAHAGLGALMIAFLGGAASFLSPCVAPLIPGYIGYLSGTTIQPAGAGAALASTAILAPSGGGATATLAGSGAPTGATVPAEAVGSRRGGTLRVSLLFVAGFSVAFIGLGLLVGGFGSVLAAYKPVMQTIAGIVMVAMGAFLLGLLPRGWTDLLLREGRLRVQPRRLRGWGAAGPFALGVVFAAGWTPCIGPVLAAILVYAGASASVGYSGVLLALYALGFAVPFLAVGLGWSAGLRALGWTRRYGHAIMLVSGVLLIAVGLVYLTGEVSVFSTWASHFPGPSVP